MEQGSRQASAKYAADQRRFVSELVKQGNRRNRLSQLVASMDLVILAVFILYAVHVVVSPQDSQVLVEQHAMQSAAYGQLINGSYGQVFFLLYAAIRSLSFPRAYFALLRPLGILSVFALLSTAWSIEPLTTLHRAFDLFLCVMMPSFLVQALGFSQCCRAVWVTLSGVRRQHLWPRKGVADNGGIGSRRRDVRTADETQSLQPKIGCQAHQEARRGGGKGHSPCHAPTFLGRG